MVEQQYFALSLPHSDGLSVVSNLLDSARSSVVVPSTSAYPDLTSYEAVSSFDLPAQCDTTLLTPISAAGSPPLHHSRKVVRQYHPLPSTPATRQPTPPGSSNMYHNTNWGQQFDMNGPSSQTSSPMAPHQPVVAPDYPDNSYGEGRRTPGAPHEPYLGAFAVSDPSYYMVDQHNHPVEHANPLLRGASQAIPLTMDLRRVTTAPQLNHPQPSQFRQHRRSSADERNLHVREQRSANGSPRRRTANANGRVKRRAAKSRGGQSKGPLLENPLDEHKNCRGREDPPLLKDSCPDDVRFIFESRWKNRHQKGQDMWEIIQHDFSNRFHRKAPGKEMLQMKFKRGRSKYIEWLPEDEKILREAWMSFEKERYQMILNKFLELGGSRNMRLSASDIEVKVVSDLKLEEGLYMEEHGDALIRKRRKLPGTKKRAGASTMADAEVPLSDEMMSVSSHNTYEDEIINQAHSRPDIKWENDSPEAHAVVDLQMWDPQPLKTEPGLMPSHRIDHLGRQAYEQTLRANQGVQPVYGSRRGS